MSTEDKIGVLVVAIRMSVDNAQQQSVLNASQGKLNQQLLDILETQQAEIKRLRATVERLESWSFN